MARATKTVKLSASLKKRAAKIKVVLMDVDGTITDGSVTLLSQPDGSALEIKSFDAHDGQGISLARTAGLRMHRGNLKVGDAAPDAKLIALNGLDTFHVRERGSGKPLVLVFGSFT